MNNIIDKLGQMVKKLQDENYQSDTDAYDDFIKQYNLVENRRNQLQDYANSLGQLQKWREKVQEYKITTVANGDILFSKLTPVLQEVTEEINSKKEEYQEIASSMENVRFRDRFFNKEKITQKGKRMKNYQN